MKGRRYLVISYFWAPRLLLRSQATGDEETDRQRQTEGGRDGSTSNYQPCQGDGRGRGRGMGEEGERKREPLLLLNCPSFPNHPLTSYFPCHTSLPSSYLPITSLLSVPLSFKSKWRLMQHSDRFTRPRFTPPKSRKQGMSAGRWRRDTSPFFPFHANVCFARLASEIEVCLGADRVEAR